MFSSGSRRNYGIQTCSNSQKKTSIQSDCSNAPNDRANVFFPNLMSAVSSLAPCTDVSPAARCRICILSFDICLLSLCLKAER